jgi:23S rRNA pseudouridine2604 synthase
VVANKRIRIGRLTMAGLAVGEWRYLLGYERF